MKSVLIWGDVSGALGSFRQHLREHGPVDLCVCLGDFFGPLASLVPERSRAALKAHAAELLQDPLPVETLLILDRPAQPGSLGDQLRRAFGKSTTALNAQVFLLAPCGRGTYSGLRVAHFSGAEEPDPHFPDWDDVVDLCLFTSWPDSLAQNLSDADRETLQDLLSQRKGDDAYRMRASAKFAARIQSARFYFASGGPGVFYERPGFASAREGLLSTFVGLAPMKTSFSKSRCEPDYPWSADPSRRQFTFSLKLTPWEERERLLQFKSPFESAFDYPPAKRVRCSRWSGINDDANANPGSNSGSGPIFRPSLYNLDRDGGSPDDSRGDSGRSAENGGRPYHHKAGPEFRSQLRAADSKMELGDDGPCTLQVHNLPFSASRIELLNCLSQLGPVTDLRLPRTGNRMPSRAWVTFERTRDALSALRLEDFSLHGRQLRFTMPDHQNKAAGGESRLTEPRLTEPRVPEARLTESSSTEGRSMDGRQVDGRQLDIRPLDSRPMDLRPLDSRSLEARSLEARSAEQRPPPPPAEVMSDDEEVRFYTECWFCLVNPHAEKKLIVAVLPQAYVTIARGGIVPQHLMLLPISHLPSASLFPRNVAAECVKGMQMLSQYFSGQGLGVCFFERFVPMNIEWTSHTQFHAVPLPLHLIATCHETFETHSAAQNLSLVQLGEDPAAALEALRDNTESAGGAYYFVNLPRNGELGSAAADRRHCFVLRCAEPTRRMNLHFAREVLCSVLAAPERVHWRSCVTSRLEEEKWAAMVRAGLDSAQSLSTPAPSTRDGGDDEGGDVSSADTRGEASGLSLRRSDFYSPPYSDAEAAAARPRAAGNGSMGDGSMHDVPTTSHIQVFALNSVSAYSSSSASSEGDRASFEEAAECTVFSTPGGTGPGTDPGTGPNTTTGNVPVSAPGSASGSESHIVIDSAGVGGLVSDSSESSSSSEDGAIVENQP